VQMNRDKENFPVEQKNQERNERNALYGITSETVFSINRNDERLKHANM